MAVTAAPENLAATAAEIKTAVVTPPKVVADSADKKRSSEKQNIEASTIRVSVEKVDQLLNLVGELVITQSMLAQTASTLDPVIFEKMMQGQQVMKPIAQRFLDTGSQEV